MESLDQCDGEFFEEDRESFELFRFRNDRVFGDAFCLVKVLQVFNSARGIINVFHFVNVDLKIGTRASQDEVNEVPHGLTIVALILRQPLSGHCIGIAAFPEHLG